MVAPETLTCEVWSHAPTVGGGMLARGSLRTAEVLVTAGWMLVLEPVSLPPLKISIVPGLALREPPPVTCRALLLLEAT